MGCARANWCREETKVDPRIPDTGGVLTSQRTWVESVARIGLRFGYLGDRRAVAMNRDKLGSAKQRIEDVRGSFVLGLMLHHPLTAGCCAKAGGCW